MQHTGAGGGRVFEFFHSPEGAVGGSAVYRQMDPHGDVWRMDAGDIVGAERPPMAVDMAEDWMGRSRIGAGNDRRCD